MCCTLMNQLGTALYSSGVRPPAMWVAMFQGPTMNKSVYTLQVFGDVLVSILHVLPNEVGHLTGEPTRPVQGADHLPILHDHPLSQADPVMILSKVRSLVHHSSTGICRHVSVGHNTKSSLARRSSLQMLEVRKEWGVCQPFQIYTLHFLQHSVVFFLLEQLLQSGLHHDINLLGLAVLHLAVLHIRVDTQRQVAGQCPWSCGPGYQAHTRHTVHWEGHDDGRVDHILVVLSNLKISKRCGAACRIWHHPEPLVDQPLGVKLLEDPPDALHEPGVHSLVVPLEVYPPAQPTNDLLPISTVSAHNGPTLGIVSLYPHLGYILRSLDPQLLVNLKLHR